MLELSDMSDPRGLIEVLKLTVDSLIDCCHVDLFRYYEYCDAIFFGKQNWLYAWPRGVYELAIYILLGWFPSE